MFGGVERDFAVGVDDGLGAGVLGLVFGDGRLGLLELLAAGASLGDVGGGGGDAFRIFEHLEGGVRLLLDQKDAGGVEAVADVGRVELDGPVT